MPMPPVYPTMNVPAARSEAISSACAAGRGSASPSSSSSEIPFGMWT